MTGTFRFESKTKTFVFSDENENSVAWSKDAVFGWQLWSKGKCIADCINLEEALECMEAEKGK